MPGSGVCGRCSTSLGLATAVMDVHPPRASATIKRLRRTLPARKVFFHARDVLQTDAIAVRARYARTHLLPFPVFARLIVPGWSHFFLNQRLRGHLFLWGTVACLIPAFAIFGSTWGAIWMGMAFSVHSSAALDVVMLTFADAGPRDRIARSIIVSVLLWGCVYWPAGLLLSQVAQAHVIEMSLGTFQPGDVILVNRRATLKRGDVVLYVLENHADYFRENEHRPVRVYAGENIDRILAVPGDNVECKFGRLLINGQPSAYEPMTPLPIPGTYSWTVPDDRYLILPSAVPGIARLPDPNQTPWENIADISRENIIGQAYLRNYPLSRFHRIR